MIAHFQALPLFSVASAMATCHLFEVSYLLLSLHGSWRTQDSIAHCLRIARVYPRTFPGGASSFLAVSSATSVMFQVLPLQAFLFSYGRSRKAPTRHSLLFVTSKQQGFSDMAFFLFLLAGPRWGAHKVVAGLGTLWKGEGHLTPSTHSYFFCNMLDVSVLPA